MKVTDDVCCGADLHVDAVVDDAEAVRQIFHVVDVGDVDRHLVALLDREALETEGGRRRGHVDAHLVAVADHLGIRLELHAIGLGLLDRIGEERIVALPDDAAG